MYFLQGGFPTCETLGEGLNCQSDGNLISLLILFPKIIFSYGSVFYISGNLLTFLPKYAILYSLHESHNFHEECAFLLMVKMHTPFSAFSYESSEDLCSNNWRCVFRALQLGRTFYLRGDYMNNNNGMREVYQLVVNFLMLPLYLALGLLAFLSFIFGKKR